MFYNKPSVPCLNRTFTDGQKMTGTGGRHFDGTCKSTWTFDSPGVRRLRALIHQIRSKTREREKEREVLMMLTLFHHAKVHPPAQISKKKEAEDLEGEGD